MKRQIEITKFFLTVLVYGNTKKKKQKEEIFEKEVYCALVVFNQINSIMNFYLISTLIGK